jgi:hypothetical protein
LEGNARSVQHTNFFNEERLMSFRLGFDMIKILDAQHLLQLFLILCSVISCCSPLAQAYERPEWAGFYVKTRNKDVHLEQYPFVKGQAGRLKWEQMEPERGQYRWDGLDLALQRAHEGGTYYYFVLWTGSHTPQWVYKNGVPKVRTYKNGVRHELSFPHYSNPHYKAYLFDFFRQLSKHIASLPKEWIDRIAFIQPGFGATGDRQLYKGEPKRMEFAIDDNEYVKLQQEFTTNFVEAFQAHPEIQHIPFLWNIAESDDDSKYGVFSRWIEKKYPSVLRKQQFTVATGYDAPLDQEQDDVLRNSFFGLDGEVPDLVRGEMNNSVFSKTPMAKLNPLWHIYWTALSAIDRGVDMWEINSMEDLRATELHVGYEMSNNYAYYKKAATSPRAFIALRDILDYSDTERFPESNYGKAMRNNQERIENIVLEYQDRGARVDDIKSLMALSKSKYLERSQGLNDVGYKLIARNFRRFISQISPRETSVGHWRVGPKSQPYGRYARGFHHASGKNRMSFDLHDEFLPSHQHQIKIRLIYLDEGHGTFAFHYRSSSPSKDLAHGKSMSFKKGNTGRWLEKRFEIHDFLSGHHGAMGGDFSLVNTDEEDDIFHLIEVIK